MSGVNANAMVLALLRTWSRDRRHVEFSLSTPNVIRYTAENS